MNKLNNKEEEIKDILGGLEIDIDTNDIWNSIESELPQPKKRRRFGFFIFTGLIAIGLIGFSWIMFNSNEKDTVTQSTISSSTSSNKKIIASNDNVNSEIQSSTLDTELSTKEDKIIESIQINNSRITVANHSNSIRSSSIINESVQSFKNLNSEINTINTNIQNDIATNNILTNNDVLPQLEITNNKNNTSKVYDERESIARINMTPTLSSQLLNIADRQRLESSPKEITPLSNIGRQLILQFKLGANQNSTSISNINSTSEFDASEFGFEKDRLGVSGSFAIGVENNGWRFLAGMAYHQNVSQYERSDVIVVKDLISGIESYRIASDGSVTSQNGITTVTSARDNAISFYRQHRAIDFHATIGKRLWSHQGLVLLADAGLGINTFTNTTGYYLADEAFGFTKISENYNPYKVHTHWNAIASLEIGYDFGKTRIGISPFIRYNPNSITEKTHFYQLKNSQVGMQLSLTYSPTRE